MFDDTRLLVVDDEEVICRACRRILSGHGFQVETSSDAIEGLCMAAEKNYAAIILDIKMAPLDGIQFLERLRKAKPGVPVIFITGYPTVHNAASAIRLGATDYITKPFAPEQVVGAVRKSLGHGDREQEARSRSASPEFEPWVPGAPDFHFWRQSWFQVGKDGSARLGATLTRSQGEGVEAVQLPRIGETVYQGLPLAGVATVGAPSFTVPSPLSGVVLAINELARDRPAVLLENPCETGWIAWICPTRLKEETGNCSLRRVVLVNCDPVSAGGQCERLAHWGCHVRWVRGWRDLTPELLDPNGAVLILDAASFEKHGPRLVGRINAASRHIKVVVIASPSSRWEGAYRGHKIFYYAVKPFVDNEIVDVLDAAFQSSGRFSPQVPTGGHSLDTIDSICTTNDTGRKVRLLATGGLLRRDEGLGWHITCKLRDRWASVEVSASRHTAATSVGVLRATEDCDHLFILAAKDTGRLPGSLLRDTLGNLVSPLPNDAGKVTTLTVQPVVVNGGPLVFDPDTTAALAEHIVEVMASCGEAAADIWNGR